MLKTSSIGFLSHSSLPAICTPSPPLSTSPRKRPTPSKNRTSFIRHIPSTSHSLSTIHAPSTRSAYLNCRAYAVVADGRSKHHYANIPWPEVTAANALPTPYQIFNLKKGSSYSKRRFYELVKLYHPDRHNVDGCMDEIPYATKLERYRLVVAANDILSDPIRRGAYDCYGAGWNGQPDVRKPGEPSDNPSMWGSYSGRGWEGGPAGPSRCATWEDWERWEKNGKQEPTYFSNSAFVSLIVIFAALGGIGQATRVGNYSMTFLEQRDILHDEMSKELRRRRKEANAQPSREDRIQSFLKQRDIDKHLGS